MTMNDTDGSAVCACLARRGSCVVAKDSGWLEVSESGHVDLAGSDAAWRA